MKDTRHLILFFLMVKILSLCLVIMNQELVSEGHFKEVSFFFC